MTLRVFVAMSLAIGGATPYLSAQPFEFRRGDVDANEEVELTDAVRTFGHLYAGEPSPGCDDAMDANDDGELDLTDGIYTLQYQFQGGPEPPPPFPDCGVDEDPTDPLDCASYATCPAVATCFGQAELDGMIEESVPPQVCIPAGELTTEIPPLNVTVCPLADASNCTDQTGTAPGCAVVVSAASGSLDVANRRVDGHLEGIVAGLPILIEDTIFGSSTVCNVDILFVVDVALLFTVTATPEGPVLEAVTGTIVEDAAVQLELADEDPALLCQLFRDQQDQFIDDLVAEVESAIDPLLADLSAELAGVLLCE